MQCPLEVRETIYLETIEYGAIFQLGTESIFRLRALQNKVQNLIIHPAASLKNEKTFVPLAHRLAALDDVPGLQRFHRQASLQSQELAVGYKVPQTPCTPLWNVNTSIRTELEDLPAYKMIRTFAREVISALFFGGDLSIGAYDLCKRSRFELLLSSSESMQWLWTLEPKLGHCIRSLVLLSHCLDTDTLRNIMMWTVPLGPMGRQSSLPFMQVLQQRLPHLTEIALSWREHDAVADKALACFGDMLEHGKIKELRILLDEAVENPTEHWRWKKLLLRDRVNPGLLGVHSHQEAIAAVAKEQERIAKLGPRFEMAVDFLDKDDGAEPIIRTGPAPFCYWPDALTVIKLRNIDVHQEIDNTRRPT